MPAYAAFKRWLGRDPDDPSVAEELAVIGSADRCRRALAEYAAAGAHTLLSEALPGAAGTVEMLAGILGAGPPDDRVLERRPDGASVRRRGAG